MDVAYTALNGNNNVQYIVNMSLSVNPSYSGLLFTDITNMISDTLSSESIEFIMSELRLSEHMIQPSWEYIIRCVVECNVLLNPTLLESVCNHAKLCASLHSIKYLLNLMKDNPKSNWIEQHPSTQEVTPNELFTISLQDDINQIYALSQCTKRTKSKLWKGVKDTYPDIYALDMLKLPFIPQELPLLLVVYQHYFSSFRDCGSDKE